MARVTFRYHLEPILDGSYGISGHQLLIKADFMGVNSKERAEIFRNVISHVLLERFPVKDENI